MIGTSWVTCEKFSPRGHGYSPVLPTKGLLFACHTWSHSFPETHCSVDMKYWSFYLFIVFHIVTQLIPFNVKVSFPSCSPLPPLLIYISVCVSLFLGCPNPLSIRVPSPHCLNDCLVIRF